MRKVFVVFIFIIALAFSVSAQNKEARKIAEFGFIPCGHFDALMDSAFQDYKNSPDSKIYVIFYGGLNQTVNTKYNKKTKSFETKKMYPRRGNAINRAKEVPLYFKTEYKLPNDKVVLLEGGFRRDFELEIWIVPKNAELPKPSLTVDEKDVIFGQGKPVKTRDCARVYDGYK